MASLEEGGGKGEAPSREAVLAARKERKRVAKEASREACDDGGGRRCLEVPLALLDRLDRVSSSLSPVVVRVSPNAAAARAFDALVSRRRRTFQSTNRGTHQLQYESLISVLETYGLLGDECRVVELGAGQCGTQIFKCTSI